MKKLYNFFIFWLCIVCPLVSMADQYKDYNSSWAAEYAKKNYDKAYGVENQFGNFDGDSGGNCTNFVSQSIVAGLISTSSMKAVYDRRLDFNIDKICYHKYQQNISNPPADSCSLAWYYDSDSERGPAWSGADKLYEYAKGNKAGWPGLHFQYVTDNTSFGGLDVGSIQVGDIIFADWGHDGIIDHSMIVTRKDDSWYSFGYNRIRVTYQSNNRNDRGLGDIDYESSYKSFFYVYRPVNFDPKGIDENNQPTTSTGSPSEYSINKCLVKFYDYFGEKTSSVYSCKGTYVCQNTSGGRLGNVTTIAVSIDPFSNNQMLYKWGGWGSLPLYYCD